MPHSPSPEAIASINTAIESQLGTNPDAASVWAMIERNGRDYVTTKAEYDAEIASDEAAIKLEEARRQNSQGKQEALNQHASVLEFARDSLINALARASGSNNSSDGRFLYRSLAFNTNREAAEQVAEFLRALDEHLRAVPNELIAFLDHSYTGHGWHIRLAIQDETTPGLTFQPVKSPTHHQPIAVMKARSTTRIDRTVFQGRSITVEDANDSSGKRGSDFGFYCPMDFFGIEDGASRYVLPGDDMSSVTVDKPDKEHPRTYIIGRENVKKFMVSQMDKLWKDDGPSLSKVRFMAFAALSVVDPELAQEIFLGEENTEQARVWQEELQKEMAASAAKQALEFDHNSHLARPASEEQRVAEGSLLHGMELSVIGVVENLVGPERVADFCRGVIAQAVEIGLAMYRKGNEEKKKRSKENSHVESLFVINDKRALLEEILPLIFRRNYGIKLPLEPQPLER